MKPSHSQLENLRAIAAFENSHGLAERFALPLVRHGWAKKVGEAFYFPTATLYLDLILTDAGEELVASMKGRCSKCKCTHYAQAADDTSLPIKARAKCVCGHFQHRHGGAL